MTDDPFTDYEYTKKKREGRALISAVKQQKPEKHCGNCKFSSSKIWRNDPRPYQVYSPAQTAFVCGKGRGTRYLWESCPEYEAK